MRSFSKPKRPAPDKSAPKTANADTTSDTGPPSDFGWHESSYELARGLDVIECEWPDTTSGVYSLD
jgi:hypothetical protein